MRASEKAALEKIKVFFVCTRCYSICLYALAEVAAAIRRLKSGKTAEDKIRPETLKILNGGVRWLTRVCLVAWKLRKTPKILADKCDHSYMEKGDLVQCTVYELLRNITY